MSMHELTLNPSGQVIGVKEDQDLFSQLKALGISLKSTCGGCASCGQCVIEIVKGEDHLNGIPFEESQLLGNVFHITKERLACQTKISGNVTIDITRHLDQKTTNKPIVKKRSKQEAESILEERRQNRKDKPKKVGGNKRPKPFNYQDEE
jgi:2Fe-2S ferredoxin